MRCSRSLQLAIPNPETAAGVGAGAGAGVAAAWELEHSGLAVSLLHPKLQISA